MFCRSLFVILYFFFWPLSFLFFDIRMLISLWFLQTLLMNDIYICLPNLWEYEPRYRQFFHFLECYSSDLINILKIFTANLWRGGGFCSSSKIGRNDIADNGLKMTINTHHAHQLVGLGWYYLITPVTRNVSSIC
jgi:hypothetical protein